MNIDRLRINTPVLIKVIRSEYNLSYQHIAMVFNVKPQTVVEWEFGNTKPEDEMISAMILAYRWMKFWTPFKMFLRFLRLVYIRAFNFWLANIKSLWYKLVKKNGQISLDI